MFLASPPQPPTLDPMTLRTPLILLAFLVLVVGCQSDQIKQEDTAEPTGTGMATQEGPRRPLPGDRVRDYCSPLSVDYDATFAQLRVNWRREDYIQWSSDGSQILFTFGDVYGIGAVGVPQSKIIGLVKGFDLDSQDSNDNLDLEIVSTPERDPFWGDDGLITYVDVSPDDSRFAFSTCAFTELTQHEIEELGEDWRDYSLIVTDLTPEEIAESGENRWGYIYIDSGNNSGDATEAKRDRVWLYDFGIFISNIDGTDVERLRENISRTDRFPDTFPVWSPDGSRIAFMTGWTTFTIYEVGTGSFEEIPLGPSYFLRPTWSPDGERVAFVGQPTDFWQGSRIPGLYTIRADGSELTRIADAASGPAWSPDGTRIALVARSGSGEILFDENGNPYLDAEIALYTFAADGSDPILVNDNLPDSWNWVDFPREDGPWLGDLSWSPDGSEILLKGFGHRVPLDGSPPSDVGPGFITPPYVPRDASWSPDGSMIAFFGYDTENPDVLLVADRNGENVRTLLEFADIESAISQIEWDQTSQ